ncbi:MAG: preprotein translocase subunit SecA [Planctomycetaceae bacterium]|nr:preprotein translocase subunit SecA [Planctomycetaceae bacterium]
MSALDRFVPRGFGRWRRLCSAVSELEQELTALPDEELRKRSLGLRYRAKSGERLAKLVPEGFGLVREAARRKIGLRHFDVQLIGGAALFDGSIAEMETGEGKTLTATLPLYMYALAGKGSHLATVNDYLAERDCQEMGPIFQALGLTVGVVLTEHIPDQRRAAYGCDITYGTAKEFGFDFLRDRLLLRRMGRNMDDFLGAGSSHRWDESGEQPVQRSPHFVVVDEADSILIDEARTPLIISAVGDQIQEEVAASYSWAAAQAPQFLEDEHYESDQETRRITLTLDGRQLVRNLPHPAALRTVGLIDLYEFVERAIKVSRDFLLERQYVVRDGEIVIVDEYTGRLSEGRKWRDGIHQAIEAKEGVEVTVPTGQAARITVQDLFLRYRKLAGMTGTAVSSAREFRKIYKAPVLRIPTNRPIQRAAQDIRVFGDSDGKWQAIVAEVDALRAAGRPVLIGTRSITKSELLSKLLNEAGIEHQVLNAKEIAKEAEIVSQAGQAGRVTVATNMAGRGTDIKLGEGVAKAGGLHVICTEMHDAARIDRQLTGRCGRQGDPGTHRQFLALNDDILQTGFGAKKAVRWEELGRSARGALTHLVARFQRAQRKVERRHLRDRAMLLYHERERKKVQREMGQDPYLDTAE